MSKGLWKTNCWEEEKKKEKLPPPRLEMSKHPHVLSDLGPVCVNRATVKFPEKGGEGGTD